MTAGPPGIIIAAAIATALESPCGKSKRGVVVFNRPVGGVSLHGAGWNGMPGGAMCTNDEACRRMCAQRCVHAEVRAIRAAVVRCQTFSLSGYDAVHVKIDAGGKLVAGGGPSCWQCSREVLDVGLGGFWLYERQDEAQAAAVAGGCDVYLVPQWRRYTALEFHAATMAACGLTTEGE